MSANDSQKDYWTSPAGLKWIEHEQALDTAMQGLSDAMLDAADIAPGHRVLDVGCGTGASTIDAAARAKEGHACGVDISEPLIGRATERAQAAGIPNISFRLADAQTHRFDDAPFDRLVSRIGMSFFSDPVAAFRNLARAMTPGGRMAFVCWAAVERNPWFFIPARAARDRLGNAPAGDPRAPGPTAFRELDHVADLMAEAGLSDIGAEEIPITLTPPHGVAGAARAASRVGPAARIMKAHQGTPADADAIEITVARLFAPYRTDVGVRIPAAVNLFTCRS